MGARIEAASALTGHGLRKPTARRLADAAARACLAHAGREPGDVDMLINAGIYREDNMGEPALAALIQEDIGANLGQPPGRRARHLLVRPHQRHLRCDQRHPARVGPAALRRHPARCDRDQRRRSEAQGSRHAAPFRPAGGAMLLGWDDTDAGFTDFARETFPEYQDLFVSGLVWQERRGHRVPRGQPARARWSSTPDPATMPALSTAPRRRPTASCAAWGWASARSTCSSPPPLPRTSLTPCG